VIFIISLIFYQDINSFGGLPWPFLKFILTGITMLSIYGKKLRPHDEMDTIISATSGLKKNVKEMAKNLNGRF
jgi:hypothetical protein